MYVPNDNNKDNNAPMTSMYLPVPFNGYANASLIIIVLQCAYQERHQCFSIPMDLAVR